MNRLARVTDRDTHREIRADIERRINIDEVDFAPELFEQCGYDQFVVTPDQPIPKVIAVSLLLIEKGTLSLGARTWLID